MDSAVSRLIADSITQPLLMRLQSNFCVKADNTGILVADCSSFTDLRLRKNALFKGAQGARIIFVSHKNAQTHVILLAKLLLHYITL